MKKLKLIFLTIVFSLSISIQSNSKPVPASFADLAEKLMPSVVNISTSTTVVTNSNPLPFQFPPGSPFEDMFKEFGTPQERKSAALGSGFIIDENGIVVTNNHVIQDADDIIVRVNGDQEYKAKVLGADPLMDIAVLQLETEEKFKPVGFGDSDKARIGDWVLAIGNPFGLGGTVTAGIISARNRSIGLSRYEDFIQTDASINSGNSGGPLFDMEGNVIGINTAILGRNGSIGIGFSIPSNSAQQVIKQLIEFGETKRGWLGVRIQDVTKEIAEAEELDKPRGALVASVAVNTEKKVNKNLLINGRNLTNLGLFRNYTEAYLESHPQVNTNMTIMCRQLAPSSQGIPLEIYVFSKDKEWKNYEHITSDIFDHLLASTKYFYLECFEFNPSISSDNL